MNPKKKYSEFFEVIIGCNNKANPTAGNNPPATCKDFITTSGILFNTFSTTDDPK